MTPKADDAETDRHVVQVNDLREHDDSRTCWCQPRIEYVESFLTGEQSVLVVHHSLDGRELIEQHGIN